MKTYTVKTAAEELGISVALTYALVAAKKLRHERHGLRRGTIRIPEDAIEEYRRSVTEEAVTAGPRRFKHLT